MIDDRTEALLDLIRLRRPTAEARRRLQAFPWDSDTDLVLLTPADLRRVLDGFASGHLTAEEVEEWANAIESRDDVGFDELSQDLVFDCLFELANPRIERPLIVAIPDWIGRLPVPPDAP